MGELAEDVNKNNNQDNKQARGRHRTVTLEENAEEMKQAMDVWTKQAKTPFNNNLKKPPPPLPEKKKIGFKITSYS